MRVRVRVGVRVRIRVRLSMLQLGRRGLQAACLHDGARLIEVLGDVQLVRVAFALHLHHVRRLGVLVRVRVRVKG